MLGVTLLARLPSLWEPRWSHDEGTLAAIGQGLLHGHRLYVEIWDNQQPLVYLWMAGVLALTRGWHPAMQLVLALQVLVATGFVYLLAGRLGGRPAGSALLFGLAAALPVVEGDLQNVELIGLHLFLAGTWLGISGGGRRAVAGGALLSAAALCEPGLALQALAVAWFALLSGRPLRLPLLGAGAAAVLTLVYAGLAGSGSYPAYLATLKSERAYLIWANGGAELAPISLLLRIGPIAAALLAGLRIGWEQKTPAARLLGAWLPLALVSAVASPRGFMHYSLLVLAPLSLLLGLWITRALFAPLLVGLVLGLQALMFLPRLEMFVIGPWPYPRFQYASFGWGDLPGYYRNWYDRVVGVEGWEAYAGRFPGRPDQVERMAAALRVQGRLAVWGDLPWLYVETGRDPAGRYIIHNSAWRVEPHAQADSVAAIRDQRPEYVVVVDMPPPELRRQLGRQYDRLRFPPFSALPWTTYGLHSG